MICTNFGNSQGLCVSRARHRGALELRAKKSFNAFRCALNTETKSERGKQLSLEVLINQPPPMPEAVAKIRYFCVSSIKSLISSENWSSEKTTAKAQKYYLCNKILFPLR